LRLLEDSKTTRAHYACLHAHSTAATVYQTPAWLDLWKHLGADLAFIEVDDETMVPFVCRGQGAFRRAYSLPFDTYGGPVTPRPNGPVVFETRCTGQCVGAMVDYRWGVSSSRRRALAPVHRRSPRVARPLSLPRGQRRHPAGRGAVCVEVMRQAGLEAFYRLHLRTVALRRARFHARSSARSPRARPRGLAHLSARHGNRWWREISCCAGRRASD
jgi:hypothetical protein